ncbi:CAP domain-containing protein [Streptomyces sp. H27-G5]|uniref:CAP domain-containing protein n=1 Tax=Streptomyces sp. H27-G5 TaxID=2996698 RepID=UPI00226E606F|nr:CAP domain-containing protein [Streptomyces sp. H27-G5]MCY0922390.1 CAP domain-containing protein [Streptomyces sp. H27-G5]
MASGSGRIQRRCTIACASSLLVLGGTVGATTAAAAAPSARSGAQTVLPAASDPGKILELVNKARAEAGCEPLTVDPKIAAAAQEYANDTTTNHTGSDGSSIKDRLTKAGATFTTGSENIAWGSGDEKTHVDGWLKSAAHAGAIKNCNFKKTGVAVSGDRIVQVFTD